MKCWATGAGFALVATLALPVTSSAQTTTSTTTDQSSAQSSDNCAGPVSTAASHGAGCRTAGGHQPAVIFLLAALAGFEGTRSNSCLRRMQRCCTRVPTSGTLSSG